MVVSAASSAPLTAPPASLRLRVTPLRSETPMSCADMRYPIPLFDRPLWTRVIWFSRDMFHLVQGPTHEGL